jgi:ribosomal protein L29
MKKINLKETSVEELNKLLTEKREQLRTLRFSSMGRSVKDASEPKKIRADIARLMTELGARTRATAVSGAAATQATTA